MYKALILALSLGAASTAYAGDKVVHHSSENPNAPYTPVVQHGDTLYLSGQLGYDENRTLPDGITAQTHNIMKRIKSLVDSHGSSMKHVVKCTAFLKDVAEWGDFNKVYTQYFEPGFRPARSAVGIGGVPAGARVEVECIAAVKE